VRSRGVLALLLAPLLSIPEVAQTQQPSPAPPAPRASAKPASRGIRILVLQGQDAINSLAMRAAADPAVQVFDYLGEPVEGAEVTFEAPAAGPGGVFSNQQNAYKARTDARGQAIAPFTPNTLPGKFTLRVVARFGEESAEVTIRQMNSTKSASVEYKPISRPWYKDWKWWAVIGGGAGAGAYFGIRAINSSSDPTISLAPGAITIGGPR
jgi:hypothetical protein